VRSCGIVTGHQARAPHQAGLEAGSVRAREARPWPSSGAGVDDVASFSTLGEAVSVLCLVTRRALAASPDAQAVVMPARPEASGAKAAPGDDTMNRTASPSPANVVRIPINNRGESDELAELRSRVAWFEQAFRRDLADRA
jgi:hypothetical protein